MEFAHTPVLLREIIHYLKPRPGGFYIDCTVGGGGHSREILRLCQPGGFVLGIDQDDAALAAAEKNLRAVGSSFRLVKSNFVHLAEIVAREVGKPADGILFDLGVSSYQLDAEERGFSYRYDAPLDMRMDPQRETTAADLVNNLEEKELARIIRQYGEERFAAEIARAIVTARRKEPITTTGQLVEIVKRAIPAPARRTGPHPARRTFQALRIAVNEELTVLEKALEQAVAVLKPGGRVAVISFHSLEDRIVKNFFSSMAAGCICPPRLPVCTCGKKPQLKVITKGAVIPGAEEVAANPRARSAKLRVAEKLAAE